MAATADMNRLMDNCRVRLPGALDPSIQREMFACLDELFKGSNCWTEDIEVPVLPDTTSYEIAPTDPGLINRLMSVVNADNSPQAATMSIPGTLVLRYAPSEATTYTATVALTVTDPVTREGYPQFPAWILAKYGTELMDGILGKMMSHIAKPYSNERMGIYHMRKFTNLISKASVDAHHSNVYGNQNWAFPQQFAQRRLR
jgi:hypothetical protein